jgi:hypothetical protein
MRRERPGGGHNDVYLDLRGDLALAVFVLAAFVRDRRAGEAGPLQVAADQAGCRDAA